MRLRLFGGTRKGGTVTDRDVTPPRPLLANDLTKMMESSLSRWVMYGVIVYTVWDQLSEFDWRYFLCIGIAISMGIWSFFRQAYFRYGDNMGRLKYAKKLLGEISAQGRFASRALVAHLKIHGIRKSHNVRDGVVVPIEVKDTTPIS